MKRHIYKSALLLILAALSGCKVSKDTAAPKAAPETFRNAVKTDSSSIGDLPWKSFFTDAVLQKLIDSAIVKNYDMQAAVKNIEESRLLMRQAKLGYWPDLRLNAGATTSRPSDNSLNGISLKNFLGTDHIEDFTAGVSLVWEADIWGKIRNQRRSTMAAYLQSTEVKKFIQTNVVSSVSQGYYHLLMLDAQLAIAQRNLALNDSTLTIINLQFHAGQVTSLAIQQAEAQQLVAAQLVPQLEQSITIQENALSILAGEFPVSKERGAALSALNLPESLSTGVPVDMVARRPDVKTSELALNIANAKVGITKANMYPALAITAGGGVNAFKAASWFMIPASLFGLAGAGITQPLFQRKQLKTQYKVALVQRERTVIEFRKSVLVAVGEVSDALVKIEKLKQQQDIVAKRVNTLHGAINNANLLFKNGMANYLEVITVQSSKLQAELNLATIQRQHLGATVELYKALGGGWK